MDAKKKISVIGPVSRIEGHLEFHVEVEDGLVKDAHSSGVLFRGFENILQGKDPRDALYITPRICGVCPASHATASVKALDEAYGVGVPENALLVRNVILAANTVMSHITHFYALWAPDLVNKKYASHRAYQELTKRFSPLSGSSYFAAVRARVKPHEIIAIFGGKMPHSVSHVPGGVTVKPTLSDITKAYSILLDVQDFTEQIILGCTIERWLENKSLADVQKWMGEDVHAQSDLGVLIQYGPEFALDKIGKGCGKFLSYGVYDQPDGSHWLRSGFFDGELHDFDQREIGEHVKYSWYVDYEGGKHPSEGITEPEFDKSGEKYSWLKAPRYADKVVEVGPLARMICDLDPLVLDLVEKLGVNAYTRVIARLHECVRVLAKLKEWIMKIDPSKPFFRKAKVPRTAQAMGLTEAPRGALGHWISIERGRIRGYQVVTPTVWNASPRDSRGNRGPIEQSVIGTPVSDESDMIEVQHIIRSFDPCIACSVHSISPKNDVSEFEIWINS